MRTMPWVGGIAAAIAALVAGGFAAAAENDPPQKEPGPASAGQVCGWKSADGLAYEYYVPKGYDAAKGANLLFILHGSNLTRRWGFANHTAGEFRPDDVIVCPDGTTSNGNGGFNFMRDDRDLKRVHALQDEMRKAFKVNATYLYGHSQGSYFAFLYAGTYPDDVQGVLGQASGVWGGTPATPKSHHQAVALMHGTGDPVVPYAQSVGGLSFFRDAKYPLVHLRSLEGWNHWPNQGQAAQELAWCEGMTSADPARVVASFDLLDRATEESGFDRDLAALGAVARRLAAMEGAPKEARDRAAKSAQTVEDLAKRHADAISQSLGKGKGDKLVGDAWVGHLPPFLRDFDGTAACDALAKEWADRLAKQKAEAVKSLKEYFRTREKEPAKAFAAAVDAIRDGFLWCECSDPDLLSRLGAWRGDSTKWKLAKADVKAYDDVVTVFVAARQKGRDEYAEINKKP